MYSFSNFLIEMTMVDAMSTLNLKSGFSSTDLKVSYRRASSKNHPDKGGSTEAMQRINQAYEILNKNIGYTKHVDAQQARHQQWRDLAAIVRDDLVKNLNLKAYTKHFESLFGEDFAMIVNKIYPQDTELDRISKLRHSNVPHYVNVNVEWNNHDRTKVLQLNISVGMASLFNAGGLATSDTTYQMGVQTFAYVNGRKLKITARDYTHTAKKAVFTKPETVFPKTKLIKKKQTKFKKSDMLSALKAELRAKTADDFFFIPVKDDAYLAIFRTTMMRKGMWCPKGVYNRVGSNWREIKEIDVGFYSFMEEEDTLDLFRKVSKLKAKDVDRFLKTEYNKRKG